MQLREPHFGRPLTEAAPRPFSIPAPSAGGRASSSLGPEEVETVSTFFFFYCDLFRTTFDKLPRFIVIVSGKSSSIKVVLV